MRIPFLWVLMSLSSCSTPTYPESNVAEEPKVIGKQVIHNKTADKKGTMGRLITAEIVSKPFIKKNGAPTSHVEYYVRRSIQDYFIKFCASKVSREEVEKILGSDESKMLSLEIEIKTGLWDTCDTDLENPVQSRTGEYTIIHKINE